MSCDLSGTPDRRVSRRYRQGGGSWPHRSRSRRPASSKPSILSIKQTSLDPPNTAARAAGLAAVLGSSSEGVVVEGNVVGDEGVCDADHSADDGDEGDFCGFSCGAEVERSLLEFRMTARCDQGGHGEGGAQGGTAPGDGV